MVPVEVRDQDRVDVAQALALGTGWTRRSGPTRARVTGSVSSRTPSSPTTTDE